MISNRLFALAMTALATTAACTDSREPDEVGGDGKADSTVETLELDSVGNATIPTDGIRGFVVKAPGPGELHVNIRTTDETAAIALYAKRTRPADPEHTFYGGYSEIVPLTGASDVYVFVRVFSDGPVDIELENSFVAAIEVDIDKTSNDTADSFELIDGLDVGKPIIARGSISDASDVDFFRWPLLSCTEGGVWLLDGGAGFGMGVQFSDGSGYTDAKVDEDQGAPGFFDDEPYGSYYILDVKSPSGATGEYRMLMTLQERDCD